MKEFEVKATLIICKRTKHLWKKLILKGHMSEFEGKDTPITCKLINTMEIMQVSYRIETIHLFGNVNQ